ncbi:MAG: methionyl-tRNA formyltransferase [Syntrophomonadaceae bacterium]|jgi:methionyl-tRNA formyltransferase
MNIVFMGSASFALPFLKQILDYGYHVTCVVTQPDRPSGRGRKIIPTPIKQLAVENNITVFQPERVRDPEAVAMIANYRPDLIVVVAYGQIIPGQLLELPRYGCINVHPSLLPRYRGPAPVQRAILAGDTITGITTMFMDEGLDTGDIIMQKQVDIGDTMDCGQVFDLLAEEGCPLLIQTINSVASGTAPRIKQNNELATYAPLITRQDELLDWSEPAVCINNRIRALSPLPGTYSSLDGTRFKIFAARVVEEHSVGEPGEVREVTDSGFRVQSGKGTLEILEVQKEGKKRMSCKDFLKGFSVSTGSILGS